MSDQSKNTMGSDSPFEQIKQVDSDGVEFWSARDLMSVVGYRRWQRFSGVCQNAYTSLCLEHSSQVEMVSVPRVVEIGSGALREVEDWRLSYIAVERLARYVATHKPEALRLLKRENITATRIEIELGTVLLDFCEQAGLALVHQKRLGRFSFDYCIADSLLIEVDEQRHSYDAAQQRRDKIKNRTAASHGYKLLRIPMPLKSVPMLCGTIMKVLNERLKGDSMVNIKSEFQVPHDLQNAGVITPQDFAIFQNHGYQGLYNGLSADDIHRRKKLKKSQHILDHMGTTELAANLFRSTQAEEKLRRDNIEGKENANQVHYQAGVVVRRAIAELGGTMPENLPTADSIKKLQRVEKKRLAEKNKPKKD